MCKTFFLFTVISSCAVIALAQNEIAYSVSFPNIAHHEAEISMNIPNITPGSLKVRMARSSPGRYATHEFGKNVYNVKAFDVTGKPLKVTRLSGDEYQITTIGKSATVRYTVYGNWMDGTYAGFDRGHAHMNMPATFMFPIGLDARPRVVNFIFPENPSWKVATQLKPLGENKYYAKNLQYFMDSPTDIADLKIISWDVSNMDGRKQTINYVTNTPDAMPVLENYAAMLKRMVLEHQAVWGELPAFDYGQYYFLQSVHLENAGDGMEHRNSTVIVERQKSVAGNESDQLSTFSHEFFHAWNVERLRPKTLEPFNFQHTNMSDALWLAEGFTQYYGQLLLKRAGFRTLDEASVTISGIVNTVLNTPGAKYYSPVEASNYGVFADAGVAIDQTNK
ncbi:MAG: M61 family peptidase, partial [Chitinophagaceae bacterium]